MSFEVKEGLSGVSFEVEEGLSGVSLRGLDAPFVVFVVHVVLHVAVEGLLSSMLEDHKQEKLIFFFKFNGVLF